MVYWIKDAIEGKQEAHKYFLRFGKGNYPGRGLLKIDTSRLSINGSFENVNSLIIWLSQQSKLKVSGKILSKSEIDNLIEKTGLKIISKKAKRERAIFEYSVEGECNDLTELGKAVYFFLLDAKSNGYEFKCKKNLPRPGKSSELKIDEKFFSLHFDNSFASSFKKEFLFDIPEGKKISISHDIIINDIIIPKELAKINDFAKIREEAKRKGKIIRKANVDGKEILKEYNIEI